MLQQVRWGGDVGGETDSDTHHGQSLWLPLAVTAFANYDDILFLLLLFDAFAEHCGDSSEGGREWRVKGRVGWLDRGETQVRIC